MSRRREVASTLDPQTEISSFEKKILEQKFQIESFEIHIKHCEELKKLLLKNKTVVGGNPFACLKKSVMGPESCDSFDGYDEVKLLTEKKKEYRENSDKLTGLEQKLNDCRDKVENLYNDSIDRAYPSLRADIAQRLKETAAPQERFTVYHNKIYGDPDDLLHGGKKAIVKNKNKNKNKKKKIK